jgi:hypothetical protein
MLPGLILLTASILVEVVRAGTTAPGTDPCCVLEEMPERNTQTAWLKAAMQKVYAKNAENKRKNCRLRHLLALETGY